MIEISTIYPFQLTPIGGEFHGKNKIGELDQKSLESIAIHPQSCKQQMSDQEEKGIKLGAFAGAVASLATASPPEFISDGELKAYSSEMGHEPKFSIFDKHDLVIY